MKTNIRPLVKELLENKNLIVSYNELNDGGFDLSVRISEEALNRVEQKTHYDVIKPICPHCGSKNVQSMYETMNLDGSGYLIHYVCKDCQKEFEV